MAGKQFQWEKESMMCEVMCKAIKDMIDESKTEGIAEGIAEGIKKMALKMYKNGDSIEKIAETAEVSMNLVKEWINSAGCV
jgi:predicted transposase/invertase (TIGR01784 family)